jgi:hypothetical protein
MTTQPTTTPVPPTGLDLRTALLAGAAILAMAWLGYAIWQTLSPNRPEPAVTVAAETESWEQPQTEPLPAAELIRAAEPPPPAVTEPPRPADREAEIQQHREKVRAQAEYLRQRAAANKDPDGIGNLSHERIAELEAKGLLVW